jgi:hypothetical protein
MPIGLVTIRAVVTALGEAPLRLRPPVPNAGRRARSLALAAHPEKNLGCACALTSVGISGTPRVTARDRPGVSLLGAPAREKKRHARTSTTPRWHPGSAAPLS